MVELNFPNNESHSSFQDFSSHNTVQNTVTVINPTSNKWSSPGIHPRMSRPLNGVCVESSTHHELAVHVEMPNLGKFD